MTTLILLRHGRSSANTAGVLAGRTPGVELDETGRGQAEKIVGRLDGVPIAEIVCSPMLRCEQTVVPLAAARELVPTTEPGIAEVDYGSWTGQAIKALVKEPLWKVVQAHPSAVVFPGPEGEALRDTQARAVNAVRDWNDRLGPDATWLACSHGDVIKAIVADALGLHLDQFQRIAIDPCSVTVIRYTELRPFVVRVNDTGGGVADLLPPKGRGRRRRSSDAVVGGGAGAV